MDNWPPLEMYKKNIQRIIFPIQCDSGRFMALRQGDTMFFHHLLKVGSLQSGQFGGAGDIPAGSGERVADKFFFDAGNGRLPDFLFD